MGIIQTIKNLFKKEEKIELETVQQPVVEVQEENLGTPTGEICDICKLSISEQQRIVHKFGKAYHSKPCFRQRMKDARNFAGL
jgi:hypothetical protein